MQKLNFLMIVGIMLFICGCSNQVEKDKQQTPVSEEIPLSGVVSEPAKKASNTQIAKAAVAALLFAPVNSMTAKQRGDIIYVSYLRADDQQRFDTKIQLNGSEILWGSADGRWRTHPLDEKLSFRYSGDYLIIHVTYSDGSSNTETFKIDELK